MSRFRSQRKKNARSIASEDPWRVDTPFGPPRMSSFRGGGIQRIRNTLSRLSPSARAERELLKQKSQYKIPLTERNIDTLVTNQLFSDSDSHRSLGVDAIARYAAPGMQVYPPCRNATQQQQPSKESQTA
ncbi:uncharacterized protein NFIA_013740 [Aspergillus fischeri NRRL 181]|uniref:Uncharacterized protein n=1 Tax=Neosartorya fischeri (strain ATCC 1020 / DSM 3700 / CBS 544.65 / FGSC A1164 / JCM 1740 / NRRL 181 / WB 181) TaxID=331117 RepID=A1D2P1_NEOFI|nr:conserved hypothetical protein [Aspergillus fischeri NRRL 181]EAW22684.1 conserved hypothetical protein [Aspergillus fischeri NRRL 181]